MTKWLVLLLVALAWPSASFAADGEPCAITPPTGTQNATTVNNAVTCIDVIDRTSQNAAIETTGIWLPVQNADSTTFTVYAHPTNCAVDALDVIILPDGGLDPDNFHKPIYGTLDDDSGCGLSGTSACASVDIPYPVAGYVYFDSGATTIGGASCATFKVRMIQHKKQ